jgi:hypothetical protein
MYEQAQPSRLPTRGNLRQGSRLNRLPGRSLGSEERAVPRVPWRRRSQEQTFAPGLPWQTLFVQQSMSYSQGVPVGKQHLPRLSHTLGTIGGSSLQQSVSFVQPTTLMQHLNLPGAP